MDCDACDKVPATVFFSNVVDGKVQKVNLCKCCADESGVNDPTGYALMDMLEGMGEETVISNAENEGELTCSTCGFTQTDFKKTGRFGCSDCYSVFDEGLEGLLEAMHKHTEHTGKVPVFAQAEHTEKMKTSKAKELAELRTELDDAIRSEAYETAAALRDQIKNLESELSEL
ncbi:MAG: UvrB/UvrC motif-containing protein [Verrucomicrobiota bacterium]